MPSRLLPLFPLQVVVFPRTRLPLHIFEERYKLMVGEAIRDGCEFGIVLAGEQGIANAGCSVAVEKVLDRYPDGRMDILTRGLRRFEIVSLDEELDYLRAEVHYFDDEDQAQPEPEIRKQVLRHFRSLKQLGSARPAPSPTWRTRSSVFNWRRSCRPRFSQCAAAAAVGGFPAQTAQPISGGLHSAAARH